MAKGEEMRSGIFLVCWLFCSMGLWAQDASNRASSSGEIFERVTLRTAGQGEIVIHQSPQMKELVLDHIAMNKRANGVEGFRVQLFSGSGSKARQEAMEVKSKVLSFLPPGQIFVEYNAPFWRVRAGSFRHKHEALPLLHQLKSDFPNCYVVKEFNLKLSDLP